MLGASRLFTRCGSRDLTAPPGGPARPRLPGRPPLHLSRLRRLHLPSARPPLPPASLRPPATPPPPASAPRPRSAVRQPAAATAESREPQAPPTLPAALVQRPGPGQGAALHPTSTALQKSRIVSLSFIEMTRFSYLWDALISIASTSLHHHHSEKKGALPGFTTVSPAPAAVFGAY